MVAAHHEIDSYFLFHMTENFGQTTIINCQGGGWLKRGGGTETRIRVTAEVRA